MMATACVLLVSLSGCDSDTGPKLVPVSGTVRLDDQPLPRGSITLRPESSKDGWEQPTGSIEADGKFVIYTQGRAGAPPGHYRVVVFATGSPKGENGAAHPGLPVSLIPAMYNDPAQTPLSIQIEPGTNTPFDWELTTHAKR